MKTSRLFSRNVPRFAIAFFACAALTLGTASAHLEAPDANSVLILERTVYGGTGSPEYQQAMSLGYTPVLVDDATWGAMTAAEFATYRALVLGDPRCGVGESYVAAAVANRTVWGPEVTGNVIVNVTDPVYHGKTQVTRSALEYAADADGTGMYISLSCYYYNVPQGSPVSPAVLEPFGSFDVFGQLGGCPADAHIVAIHPALAGLADADLSNWGCSAHGGFQSWPSNFNVLVIAEDLPAAYVASDGSSGLPYFVARGEDLAPIACGDGEVMGDEECDDGNREDGDGCSSTCRLEDCEPAPEVCDNQIDDDCDGLVDLDDTEDCEDLYVELDAFGVTPGDRRVRVDWSTALEVDNAGFYLLRRDVLTGNIVRLNAGLIPARGDIVQGASYSYLDATAVNGVEYEYALVDVELGGRETTHPGTLTVANPVDPDVRLVSPTYGFDSLEMGTRPTFRWGTSLSQGVLMISGDPAFAGETLYVAVGLRTGASDQVTLSPRQARRMERMALDSGGVLYWQLSTVATPAAIAGRVRASDVGTLVGQPMSDTFRLGYHLDVHLSGAAPAPGLLAEPVPAAAGLTGEPTRKGRR